LKIENSIKNNFFRVLLSYLTSSDSIQIENIPGYPEYLEWRYASLLGISNEFISNQRLLESTFIKKINRTFRTKRFNQLLKKWIAEYLILLFDRLYEFCYSDKINNKKLLLEDNPINRFGVEKFNMKFKIQANIQWVPGLSLMRRILSMPILMLYVFSRSIGSGIKLSSRKKKFKVMREAIWGLNGLGYFFHDDFLVDGKIIKKDELLLFSRCTISESIGRKRAYQDAQNSEYTNYYLPSLKIGAKELLFRVFPKYIFQGSLSLLAEINSANFSLYENIFHYFNQHALPYERVFSNFSFIAELGHSYFSSSHIAEAIICQNYGAKYYLMHWSDISVVADDYLFSSLGCDYFLLWGRAHITGVEGDYTTLHSTGYVFKNFINQVKLNRRKVLKDMGINERGKIITFFDEPFGRGFKMTADHYVSFWNTALRLAQEETQHTVVIKPKDAGGHCCAALSPEQKNYFLQIKDALGKLDNVYIIDAEKWSFIEAIGISDIVITEAMSSPSTIAIICGIEGLYLDEAAHSHPFVKNFKDKIVFDDPQKLLDTAKKIIRDNDSALQRIPQSMLREYDEYPDDRGIEIFRNMLSGRLDYNNNFAGGNR